MCNDSVNKGYFILVKSISNSVKLTSLDFIVEDARQDCIRVSINKSDYNTVEENTWMIIKEPLFKLC
jgi:hypothetical protein